MCILSLDKISYRYAGTKVNVLENISYDFIEGKIYAVVGKSGAGKTTLLSVLSSLASPTEGRILLNNKDISNIDKYDFRSSLVGVIFQSYNLLTHLSALENVVLSMDISGVKINNKQAHAKELLHKIGISEEDMHRRVLKLSGGQQQRVAIARALSYNPKIILADEPTGNLDMETQSEILKIFRQLADEGKCIIIVTHSPEVAKEADVVFELEKYKKKSQQDKR